LTQPATYNPEHPGGCYTCRYFGRENNVDEVQCAKPGDEHVRAQASNGCAFWQREPGADFDIDKNENPANGSGVSY